jgi:hypothetical protein
MPLVRVACLRWPVEKDFEFSKDHFGLDYSQVATTPPSLHRPAASHRRDHSRQRRLRGHRRTRENPSTTPILPVTPDAKTDKQERHDSGQQVLLP